MKDKDFAIAKLNGLKRKGVMEMDGVKWELKYSGDLYEDKEEFKTIIFADMFRKALFEIRDEIRTRCKYGHDLSQSELDFLDKIQSIAIIPGYDT